MSEASYGIRLGGEGGVTFRVHGWESGLTLQEVADILSKLTGWSSTHLLASMDDAMRKSDVKVWKMMPAALSYGTVPHFLIAQDN